MEPVTVILIIWGVLSTLFNIWQGWENWDLKKKISALNEIITRLDKQIEDLKKELEAQRWWNLRTKFKLKHKIICSHRAISRIEKLIKNKDEAAMDKFWEKMKKIEKKRKAA